MFLLKFNFHNEADNNQENNQKIIKEKYLQQIPSDCTSINIFFCCI